MQALKRVGYFAFIHTLPGVSFCSVKIMNESVIIIYL